MMDLQKLWEKNDVVFVVIIVALLVGFIGIFLAFDIMHEQVGPPSETGCAMYNNIENNPNGTIPSMWCFYNETGWHYNRSFPITMV